MEKQFYTVGEVSKLTGVPIRTLHYYDEIGLLKPAQKDTINGYRYYAKTQLIVVSTIQQFKLHGFSIKEMKEQFMHHDAKSAKELLEKKRTELKDTIDELIQLQQRMDQYLQAFQYYDKKLHLKFLHIPAQSVAYIREQGLADKPAFMARFAKLQALLKKHKLRAQGTLMAIYYDDYHDYNPDKADIEVCIPVDAEDAEKDYIRIFPAFDAVSAIHYGPYNQEAQTYAKMLMWIAQEGYEICGAAIENYLIDGIFTENEEEYITELLIPIKK